MAEGRNRVRVGITGASSDLGRLLLPRLLADERVGHVAIFDVSRPDAGSERCSFQRFDLLRPGAEADLERALSDARLDAFFHLAFVNSRLHRAAFAHELEVIGTIHLLAAIGAVGVRRLIVPSLTALYGARPSSPATFLETDGLSPVPGVRFVMDRVEVERQLAAFIARANARNPSG